MQLLLETREVGRVTVVRCSGRVVSGEESESLFSHIGWLLHDRRAIVLQMSEVAFVDSSGLGTMVRCLTAARKKGGDIKLCNLPSHVRKVLELTHLMQMFDSHDSEENAIACFYRSPVPGEQNSRSGTSLLCVDASVDVLAYLREFLRRAGYDVDSSASLPDALVLMSAKQYRLVLTGRLRGAQGVQERFQQACARVTVLPLGEDFSALDAGEAGSALLDKISTCLKSSAQSS